MSSSLALIGWMALNNRVLENHSKIKHILRIKKGICIDPTSIKIVNLNIIYC